MYRWYKLYISNPSTGYKFVQWYEIEDGYSNYPEVDCTSRECFITINFDLENGDRVFAQWYDAVIIFSAGDCSVTSNEELSNGDFEWHVKLWREIGKIWNRMNFTSEI